MNSHQQQIPKIIHQVWFSDKEPLPEVFKVLSDTWKHDYPDWKYILWNESNAEDFINEYYPQYKDLYNQFTYNIQRCDAIRYLFLYKMGGLYVDLDYESIRSIEPLIKERTCCFSEEPEKPASKHKLFVPNLEHYFNNAMIFCMPNHPFMKKIIDSVFTNLNNLQSVNQCEYVMQTTGPWQIMNLYAKLDNTEKQNVHIIPSKYVSPFTYEQSRRFLLGKEQSDELENCLQEAYAVHYFFASWTDEVKTDK